MTKHRVLTSASLISLAVLAVVATSWIRSYWVYDQVSCRTDQGVRGCHWQTYSASYPFTSWPPSLPEGTSIGVLICFGKIYFRENVHGDQLPAPRPRGFAWASDSNAIPSFSYFYAVTGDMSGKGYWTVRQITLPHGALVVLFGVIPLATLLQLRRRSGANGCRPAP